MVMQTIAGVIRAVTIVIQTIASVIRATARFCDAVLCKQLFPSGLKVRGYSDRPGHRCRLRGRSRKRAQQCRGSQAHFLFHGVCPPYVVVLPFGCSIIREIALLLQWKSAVVRVK